MLKSDNLYIIFLFIIATSCVENTTNKLEKKNDFLIKEKSIEILSKKGYERLLEKMNDTLIKWMENDLYSVNKYGYVYKIDSLFCINSTKDKIIGVQLHFLRYDEEIFSDGIQEFFGAKIKNKWYFWTGGYTPVLRKNFKGHDKKYPLSYEQLHGATIGSLKGYLDKNGNIRDRWFDSKFKSSGWGTFVGRYRYKFILDGLRIDDEKAFWEYSWKRKGLGMWIVKYAEDSVKKRELELGRKLETKEKNEIRISISSRMVLEN
jgi:hypothetical protein